MELKHKLEETINQKQKIDAVLNAYIQKKRELIEIEHQLEVLTNETRLVND